MSPCGTGKQVCFTVSTVQGGLAVGKRMSLIVFLDGIKLACLGNHPGKNNRKRSPRVRRPNSRTTPISSPGSRDLRSISRPSTPRPPAPRAAPSRRGAAILRPSRRAPEAPREEAPVPTLASTPYASMYVQSGRPSYPAENEGLSSAVWDR